MSDAVELDLGPLHDFYEFEHADEDFRTAVVEGLSLPQKRILSKYFYDERGSKLFEQITELPEYYPTRTETALLRAHSAEFAELIGPHASLVEFGSVARAVILAAERRHLDGDVVVGFATDQRSSAGLPCQPL